MGRKDATLNLNLEIVKVNASIAIRVVPMAFKDKAIANALALRHQTMDGQHPTT